MDNDLINKIKAQLYDRASSPVLLAYCVSWTTWNIRALIVIFSGGKISEKLKVLDSLYESFWSYPLQGVLYPTVCALFFIGVYPYLAKLAFWHWNKEHNKIKVIQKNQDDEKPATQEEINALRKITLERELALESEIRSLSNVNREYTQREKELTNRINQDEGVVRSLQDELIKNSEESNLKQQEINRLNEALERIKASNELQSEINSLPNENIINIDDFISYLDDFDTDSKITKDDKLLVTIKKIIDNCNSEKIDLNMLKVIFNLNLHDGRLGQLTIQDILSNELSVIEVKDALNKLNDKNITFNSAGDVVLDKSGEAFSVKSGIASLIKKLVR